MAMFYVDKRLLVDLMGEILKHTQAREINNGNLVITIVQTAKELMKANNVPMEARAYIIREAIQHLVTPEPDNRFYQGHKIRPQTIIEETAYEVPDLTKLPHIKRPDEDETQ